ncbi:MAG: hypothetical protein V3V29_06515 [Acidimicrobiia bacterium]
MIAALALSLALAVSGPANQGSLRPLQVPMPPIKIFPAPPPPVLDATAWMLWAVRENAELGSLDPDTPRPFASIAKLMTAILTVENGGLEEETTISTLAAGTPTGYLGQPEVLAGEVWAIEDLLANILVQSGNDAAVALAEHVSEDVEMFVEQMNAKAAEIGMTQTVFLTPNGLDTSGQVSTPRDLITMGMYSLRYPELLHTMRIKHLTWRPGNREIEVDSTNRLLGPFPGFGGLKTGETAAAGQVLLSYVDNGPTGLVGVVLGSSARRVATRELLAWGLTALGPRDHFYAAAAGTDLAAAFPDWYQVRIKAPQLLDPGERDPDTLTPLTENLLAAYHDLLPAILGGTP